MTSQTAEKRASDEPAHPVFDASMCQYAGLTKRELLAAMAMQGVIAIDGIALSYEEGAGQAVKFADALLKELAK